EAPEHARPCGPERARPTDHSTPRVPRKQYPRRLPSLHLFRLTVAERPFLPVAECRDESLLELRQGARRQYYGLRSHLPVLPSRQAASNIGGMTGGSRQSPSKGSP